MPIFFTYYCLHIAVSIYAVNLIIAVSASATLPSDGREILFIYPLYVCTRGITFVSQLTLSAPARMWELCGCFRRR